MLINQLLSNVAFYGELLSGSDELDDFDRLLAIFLIVILPVVLFIFLIVSVLCTRKEKSLIMGLETAIESLAGG